MESSTWQNLFEQARTVLAPVEEDLEPGEKEHLKKRREELKRQRVIKHRSHQRSAEHDRTRLRDTEAVMRADEFDPSLDEEEKKFKVRVRNRHTNRTDVRMATRAKINKLRSSKEIASVEMTGHGTAKEQKPLKKKKPISTASNVKKESTEVPSGNVKKLVSKAVKRVDTDVDGDVDHNDKQKGPLGAFVPDPSGKKRVYSRVKKEGFSDWREELELREIKDVDDNNVKKIDTKKKVKNKIIINPKLGEEVEQLGGKLISLAEKKGGKCDDCSCEGCGQNPCVECGEDHHNLDEASYPGYDEKGKKKDDRLVVTRADKKANTPAYQKYKAGDKRYKAADHLKNEEAGGAEDKSLKSKQQKQNQIKRQILLKKMQAVRSGGGEDIQASYQPDPVEKRKRKAADLYRREKIAQDTPKKYKTDKTEDPQKLYKRRMAVDSKTKMKKEELVPEAKVDTGSAEDKATTRNKRNTPPGKDSKFDTSVFITRKPGESLDSARTRKRREAHAKKRGIKEADQKAFDNVVSSLRKKYGKDAVLTKDSPKPKPQPKAKPKPQKPLSAKEKAQREVDAQYGGAENRKAGRGLGT